MLLQLLVIAVASVSACPRKNGQVCLEVFNRCPFPIWPGIQGSAVPEGGGFKLEPNELKEVYVPDGWYRGKVWARTGCDKNYNCDTGFCGNSLKCNGREGVRPVSFASFTLNGDGCQDFYDVSMVDGFNIPVFVEPKEGTYSSKGGEYDCKRAGGCFQDLNDPNYCPPELRKTVNGRIVACMSGCYAFNTDAYCCRNEFASRAKCNSGSWKKNYPAIFKNACPKAYSHPFDDQTSEFVCRGIGRKSPDYRIQFC